MLVAIDTVLNSGEPGGSLGLAGDPKLGLGLVHVLVSVTKLLWAEAKGASSTGFKMLIF